MKKLILLIPILITIILLSCGKESPLSTEEKSQRGTISGTVKDTTGKPLSGVNATLSSPDGKVDLSGFTTVTDTAGNYTIPLVPAGTFKLTFTHAYYKDTSIANVQIAKAEDITKINVTLKRLFGSITGTVLDTAGKPATGASVKVVGNSDTADAIVGSDGSFAITGLVPGMFAVSVVGELYQSKTLTDSVKVEGNMKSEIGLVRVIKVELVAKQLFPVKGTMYGYSDSVKRVTIELTTKDGSSKRSATLLWSPTAQYQLSGQIAFPDTNQPLIAEVKAYADTISERVIGYAKCEIPANSAGVNVPPFVYDNAKPIIVINSLPDTSWIAGNIVKVTYTVSDSFGKPVAYSNISTGDTIPCDSGILLIAIPDTVGKEIVIPTLLVKDNHGNMKTANVSVRVSTWAHRYDQFAGMWFNAVTECSAGGYLVSGITGGYQNGVSSNSNKPGLNSNVCKFDSKGTLLGYNAIAKNGSPVLINQMITSSNGEIFAVGQTFEKNMDTSYLAVLKLTETGSVEWIKEFGRLEMAESQKQLRRSVGHSIAITDDGSLIVGGTIVDTAHTYWDGSQYVNDYDGAGYLMKLTHTGDIIWTKKLHGPTNLQNRFSSVCQITNGNYIALFQTEGIGGSIVFCYSPSGQTVWADTLPLSGESWPHQGGEICAMPNGEIGIIAAYNKSGEIIQKILRKNAAGQTLWEQSVKNLLGNSILGNDEDESVVLGSYAPSTGHYTDMGIYSITASEAVTHGGENNRIAISTVKTHDNGYLTVGYVFDPILENNYPAIWKFGQDLKLLTLK